MHYVFVKYFLNLLNFLSASLDLLMFRKDVTVVNLVDSVVRPGEMSRVFSEGSLEIIGEDGIET